MRVKIDDLIQRQVRMAHFRRAISACALCTIAFVGTAVSTLRADPPPPDEAKQPQPAIRSDKLLQDFGRTWVDQPLRHDFTLSNVGDAPLLIHQVEPPYGVSIVGDMPRKIGPGASATLSVNIDPESLRGPYDRSVAVLSNDPDQPRLMLNMRGECRRYVDVTPAAAGFGRIAADAFSERVITLKSNVDEPLRLTLANDRSSDGKFAWDLVETVEGREYKLFVNTMPPLGKGTLRTDIVLNTNLEKQKEIRTSAYAIVPGRIELTPVLVPLPSPNNAASTTSQVLHFSNSGQNDVAIESVTCSDSRLACTTSTLIPGRRYRFIVKFPPNYALPEGGARLSIKTDDAEQPVIEVPIGEMGAARRTAGAAQPTQRTPPKRPALELVGKPAPSYALETRLGVPLTNRELEYHPATVLNFFAPNCGFCKKQLPVVETLRDKFEGRGVRFVNVAQTMRKAFTPEETEAVLGELGVNGELAIDAGNQVGKRFSVTGFPCLFVVNQSGVIDHVVSGNKRDLADTVEASVQRLLAQPRSGDKPPSAQAPGATTQSAGG